MLSSLPHNDFPIKTFAPPKNVKGHVTRGAATDGTRTGTISAASPADIARLPEGKRTQQAFKFITDEEMKVAAPSQLPDWIQIAGFWFEVTALSFWSNNVMPHYEYIVTKIENPQDYTSL